MLTTAFRLLAKARQARAFHPRGILLRGELTGAAPFPASASVAVRLSKGAGTGRGWPDVFGLALRVPTESGDWDVLLSSTGTGRLTRLLPTPVRGWRDARLGTLAPYRYRDELMWLMAVPHGAPPTRFTIHASGTDAQWRQVAEVTLHPEDSAATPIAFDPVLNRPQEMELAPRWLAVLREQAYEGSRRGRPRS
ncbi:hypothetical protein UK23_25220 [Lentzea aerocolonigenes]|uniref:Phosphodiesterase n=1 Tax=Lentzea aerocolonigenes TaxID=68170 RepID=A0A0F0GQB1_LENAE|nr:hypothetical protein [Lentzea aerocolonigenes]KJK45684.1 hypothetical protein UK23_25220 [Lentzea aerocolonigenes]